MSWIPWGFLLAAGVLYAVFFTKPRTRPPKHVPPTILPAPRFKKRAPRSMRRVNPGLAQPGKACPGCGSRQFIHHRDGKICMYCRSEQ